MRPFTRLACAPVAAAALLVLVAACSATPTPPPEVVIPTLPPVASAAPASPSAAPAAPPPKAAPAEIADWADPGAVAHLAADCHWDPAAEEQGAMALSCEIHPDQNCNPNECDDVEQRCYSGCTGACGACGEQCVTGCDSCKQGCRDDTCRRGCADKCGACRRGCLMTKDHCATAGCVQEVIQCSDKLHADYDKSGCAKRVAKLRPCTEACVAKVEKAGKETDYRTSWECQGECVGRVMPGCDRFFSFFRIY